MSMPQYLNQLSNKKRFDITKLRDFLQDLYLFYVVFYLRTLNK